MALLPVLSCIALTQAPAPAQEAEVDDTDVSPELDWCQPPLCVLWEYSQDNPQLPVARPQPGDMYSCGEASQERQEREAYRHLHPHIDFGPGRFQAVSPIASCTSIIQ